MTEDLASRDGMPLTLPQLDFWEEFSLRPHEPLSTVAHYLDIEGEVNGTALRAAIARTVEEADVLSVRFHMPPGTPVPLQACDPRRTPVVELFDLRAMPDPIAGALALMERDVHAPLDLLRDPLSVQWLLRVGDTRYFWYLRAHHIVLDGFGISLIEQRCAQLYAHLLGHGEPGLPFHPFASFIAEEVAYGASPRFDEDRRYWTDYLRPVPRLPVARKDDEGYRSSGLAFEVALPDLFCRSLQQMSERTGIGWPDLLVLLSGGYLSWHLSLPRCAADKPLTLWLPFMSRWGSVGAHMPAMLVNILPLHVSVGPQESLGSYLARLATVLRRQRKHGRYRVEQMAADHGLAKGTRYLFSPLINVLPFNPPVFKGCRATRHVLANGPGDGFEVTFRGRDDGSLMALNLDADPALVDPAAFARHQRALPEFLMRAMTEPDLDRPMWTLDPNVTAAEIDGEDPAIRARR